jgi:hypothetical protein
VFEPVDVKEYSTLLSLGGCLPVMAVSSFVSVLLISMVHIFLIFFDLVFDIFVSLICMQIAYLDFVNKKVHPDVDAFYTKFVRNKYYIATAKLVP